MEIGSVGIKEADTMIIYRYYLTQRPPGPGTFPKQGALHLSEFARKTMVDKINRRAWGYVDYNRRLSVQEVHQYEMIAGEVYEATLSE